MSKYFGFHFLWMSLLFIGCAHMHAQNCTENGGYEKGMNDAKMGRLMAMGQFSLFCDGDDVAAAQKGYKAGYEAGRQVQGGSQMNLTFDNGKVGLVGAYNCKVTYQNQSFSENGNTEPQARNNVLDQCRKKFPSCMENQITCSKN